jgi:hypothetical protein
MTPGTLLSKTGFNQSVACTKLLQLLLTHVDSELRSPGCADAVQNHSGTSAEGSAEMNSENS